MKKLSALFLLVLAACAALPAKTAFKAKNAVILVIDGPRQSECWAEPGRPNIPNLAGKLAPQGVLLSGFRNNGPTYTNAGHTALTTGVYEEMENSAGSQLPSKPGIFQHFLKSSGLPATAAWVVTTKGKLSMLSDTQDPQWQGKFRPSAFCGPEGSGKGKGQDADTMAKVKEVLSLHHPRLMLINLKEPDNAGHDGDWKKYLKGMRSSDEYALMLWEHLQADAFYRDQTALFITHDHGRHLDGVDTGFKDHGDGCGGCRAIALLALGPDFKKGVELAEGGEQIDLPSTVAHVLGFKMPGQKGRVLKELFQ